MKKITLAAAILAAGCSHLPSVGPDYSEPDAEMERFAAPDAGMPTADRTATGEWKIADAGADSRAEISPDEIKRWWERFDDAVLDSLVDGAVSNNLSFLMAQKRLETSRWMLFGTYAAFLPRIDGSAFAQQTEKGENTSAMWGTGRTRHRDIFSAGFDATWEIDIFGGSRRETEAARAEAEAAAWNLADAWVTLSSEVGREYIMLRTTQQRIAVARTNLVLQTETYEILKSRFDSGIGDELAVSQSKYVVDQTLARIPTLLAQEEQLKNALAVLVGETPGALHETLAACPARDWLTEPAKLSEIPLDAVRARPDVRAAERRLAAQVARIGIAKSMWFPRFFVNGSLGLESVKLSKFVSRDSFYGAIGPSVSWPIFQGGAVYASVKAEEAKTDEAYLAYELALAEACGDIRDCCSSYSQEYHRYQALQGAVKAAKDAVDISNDLYRNGLKDFTAVIDAQRSLLNLEEELVISRGDIAVNLISLYKSLGGGVPENM